MIQGQREQAQTWLNRAKAASKVNPKDNIYLAFFTELLAFLQGDAQAQARLAQTLVANPGVRLTWNWGDLSQALATEHYTEPEKAGMREMIQMMEDYSGKGKP